MRVAVQGNTFVGLNNRILNGQAVTAQIASAGLWIFEQLPQFRDLWQARECGVYAWRAFPAGCFCSSAFATVITGKW